MSKETPMHARRSSTSIAAGIVAVALALAGCGRAAQGDGEPGGPTGEGGVLVVAHNGEPTNYDPQRGNGGHDHVMLWPVYETLIDYNFEDLTPEPGLAESWEWATPTQLVLHLREDVT